VAPSSRYRQSVKCEKQAPSQNKLRYLVANSTEMLLWSSVTFTFELLHPKAISHQYSPKVFILFYFICIKFGDMKFYYFLTYYVKQYTCTCTYPHIICIHRQTVALWIRPGVNNGNNIHHTDASHTRCIRSRCPCIHPMNFVSPPGERQHGF